DATAADSGDVLPIGLRERGAVVDVIPMYESKPNQAVGEGLRAAIDAGTVDLVTFASGSAVDGYVTLVGADRAKKTRAASIGPITSAAARAHSIDVVAEAKQSTTEALAEAVRDYFTP